jgi:hypothetical protein
MAKEYVNLGRERERKEDPSLWTHVMSRSPKPEVVGATPINVT